MSKTPIVRDATRNDLPGMTETLELSFEHFPPWPTAGGAEGYVEWMTMGDGADCRPAVSELDGRVVGVSTLQVRPAFLRGRALRHGNGPYTAMHPVARGRGFYRALRYYDQGLTDIGVGFSQVPQIHRLRAEGVETYQRFANPWTVYVRVLRPIAAARGHRWSLLTTPGYVWLALRGRVGRRRAKPMDVQIAPITRFDKRFDELSQEAATEFDFFTARGARYLDWRFLDPRGGAFEVLAAERGDELMGYVALGLRDGRMKIADLLTRPGHVDVARQLLDRSTERARSLGASALEYFNMEHHPYSGAVSEAGFVRLAQRSRNAAWRTALRIDSDTVREDWVREVTADPGSKIHLTLSDSELV